ncbi:hypothetical protein [Hymenobacter chitinivorans]|uniref:Uncharacterized protein n=1 Tax=Hymenobacter chitinivorans DSM 11115 TaxID=1121954 RepID=A0A2M9AQW2_9BACT|nr:hypothetical protein [Hymenobacter chitinivorans]PJJ48080.1 hypothetical protein CLV45_4773 [Hymenobacter chitinivorans DSM 11115]
MATPTYNPENHINAAFNILRGNIQESATDGLSNIQDWIQTLSGSSEQVFTAIADELRSLQGHISNNDAGSIGNSLFTLGEYVTAAADGQTEVVATRLNLLGQDLSNAARQLKQD